MKKEVHPSDRGLRFLFGKIYVWAIENDRYALRKPTDEDIAALQKKKPS